MSDPDNESSTAQIDRLIRSIDVRQFIDQMPDYIVVTDFDGIILYINRTSDRMADRDMRGTNVYDLLRPEYRSGARDAGLRAAAEGTTQNFETMSLFSDRIWTQTVAPLLDASGVAIGLIQTSRDITPLREAQQVLAEQVVAEQHLNSELRRIDAMRTEFVAKVSHDLRTPITTVYGFARTLLDRCDELDDAQRLRMIDLIASGADRLNDLVGDTLLVSQLESAEFSVSMEPFDIVGATRSLCAQMNGLSPEDRITLNAGEDVPDVTGDRQRYEQVLANVLGNALKYSAPDARVEVTVAIDHDSVTVQVADQGVGISPDDFPRLFQKFSQVGEQRASSSGTGLGLYISKALMEAQHGSIEIDSEVSVGTTVTLRFPGTRQTSS